MRPKIRKPTADEIELARNWPIWEKEASAFPWEYTESETCYIIEGEAEVVNEEEQVFHFAKGDWVVFPKGMRCTWKIRKDLKKRYDFS
jgi:hypothetical protein